MARKISLMAQFRQSRLTQQRTLNLRRTLRRSRHIPEATSRQLRARLITKRLIRNRRVRNPLPTYEISVTRAAGNIHTITASPITTATNNYSLPAAQRNIAALLRTFVREEVAASTGWTQVQSQDRIRGYLQVTNTLQPTTTFFYKFKSITEITQNRIDDIFSKMQQSETETPFENLEFMVVINPTTFETGAGTELSLKRGKGLGWGTYEDAQGPINCAAIALTLLTKKNRFDKHPNLLRK